MNNDYFILAELLLPSESFLIKSAIKTGQSGVRWSLPMCSCDLRELCYFWLRWNVWRPASASGKTRLNVLTWRWDFSVRSLSGLVRTRRCVCRSTRTENSKRVRNDDRMKHLGLGFSRHTVSRLCGGEDGTSVRCAGTCRAAAHWWRVSEPVCSWCELRRWSRQTGKTGRWDWTPAHALALQNKHTN